MNTHVMVDLETLGRRPGCRVLSIGAVVMTGESPVEFYLELDPNDQPGLTIDPETWAWWERQAPEVRDRLFTGRDKPGAAQALKQFGLWLDTVATRNLRGDLEVCLWGNGADFDNAILQTAYDNSGLPVPWPFWNNRCYRTMKSLAPDVKLARLGDHHNALDDAKSQAAHLLLICERLGLALS